VTAGGPSDERLRQLVSMVLDVPADDVGPDLDFTTLVAWSSLQQMMLASQMENAFGVRFTNEQIRGMTTWDRARAMVNGA
jgi:acyl carrier protein